MQFKQLTPEEQKCVDKACEVLERGGLVAFPTETVYGLGANADDPNAVAKVFAAKHRPTWHPLIVHLPDADSIAWWAKIIPEDAMKLADRFWPGPLTLLLPRSDRCGSWVTGGQPNVGLRCPSHPIGHALFKAFSGSKRRGLVGPSANSFGRISPTTAQHVAEDLGLKPSGAVDYILDGGPCTIGVESTIVSLSGSEPELMRYGEITRKILVASPSGIPQRLRQKSRASLKAITPRRRRSRCCQKKRFRVQSRPSRRPLARCLLQRLFWSIVRPMLPTGWKLQKSLSCTPPRSTAISTSSIIPAVREFLLQNRRQEYAGLL